MAMTAPFQGACPGCRDVRILARKFEYPRGRQSFRICESRPTHTFIKMQENFKEISEELSRKFQATEMQAKASLAIFVGGSYKTDNEKNVLTKLREELRKRWFGGAFLMEDLTPRDVKSDDLRTWFNIIWEKMSTKGLHPLFLLFAGSTAEMSQGLIIEIVEIANDPRKYECAYLFELPDVKLPPHKHSLNCRQVQNEDDFVSLAIQVAEHKARHIQNIITASESGRNT